MTRGVGAIALVASMVAVTAPSAMASAPEDVAKSIAVAKTGSSGRDLVGSEVKGHGVTVSPAKSKDGKNLRTLLQDSAGAVAVLAVLHEGQSSAVFNGMLPAGSKVTPAAGGDHQVRTPDGTRLTVKAPWARDAAGKSLPTSYTFTDGQITQHVDTTGATFPVVADPTVTPVFFGLAKEAHFNRAETLRVARVVGADNKSALACAMVLNVPVVWGWFGQCFDPTAQIAANVDAAARTAGRCLFVQMRPRSPGFEVVWDYAASGTEAC